MKIVVPLGVQTVAAQLPETRSKRVSLRSLSAIRWTCAVRARRPGRARPRPALPETAAADESQNGVDGIEPQGIDVKFGNPVERVLDEEAAHLIAVRPVEVDGLPPGRAVAVGEIGAEIPEVVSFRAEMVVDHVQDHGQSLLVAGVDQPLQTLGAAVGVLDGKGIDAVVAPVARSRETGPPASAPRR